VGVVLAWAKSQAPNPFGKLRAGPNNIEIQKSKVKNQTDNSKRKNFNLCSVTLHFYFYFLRFEEICLELGFWDLEFRQWIATSR
jgi:hypothetical protein